MSRSRLEILFDDLESEKHEFVTTQVLLICKEEYIQLLKLARCNESETPSLNRLLSYVDERLYISASIHVEGAKLEYNNLVKISKENVSKIGQQQPNTTHNLHIKHPQLRVHTGNDAPINQPQLGIIQPQTTNNMTQYQLFEGSNPPSGQIMVNQWVMPNTDLNRSKYETTTSSPLLMQEHISQNNGEKNLQQGATRQGKVLANEYENIRKYSRNILKDCLPSTETLKTQDAENNRSIEKHSEAPTISDDQKTNLPTYVDQINNVSTIKTLYPAAPLNKTQTENPQFFGKNDDRKSSENLSRDKANFQDDRKHTPNIKNKETADGKLSRSRAASAQLKRNNPNIVDLSDSNRPTKLAEKFAEMYDNEWTEAFECLETHCQQQEKSIIGLLLDVVTKAFKFSKTESFRIVTIMENAFDSVLEHGTVVNCDPKAQSKTRKCDTSMLEQYLKENAARAVPRLQKNFCKVNLSQVCRNFYLDSLPLPQCSPIINYANRCVELTWWMCVQDPPIYMDTAESTIMPVFNAATHRAYTRTGLDIDYYVWPALLLEQGGAVLMKGVAQCV